MMKKIKIIRMGMILTLFLLCGSDSGLSRDNEIYTINVSSAISPGIADFIKSGIKKASDDGVACIVIRLNTPGGLADSMREIVMDILGSRVPVVALGASGGLLATARSRASKLPEVPGDQAFGTRWRP